METQTQSQEELLKQIEDLKKQLTFESRSTLKKSIVNQTITKEDIEVAKTELNNLFSKVNVIFSGINMNTELRLDDNLKVTIIFQKQRQSRGEPLSEEQWDTLYKSMGNSFTKKELISKCKNTFDTTNLEDMFQVSKTNLYIKNVGQGRESKWIKSTPPTTKKK